MSPPPNKDAAGCSLKVGVLWGTAEGSSQMGMAAWGWAPKMGELPPELGVPSAWGTPPHMGRGGPGGPTHDSCQGDP